ncbi:hypothetical protein IWW50_001614 [Coemansia erecta]|nr:hypothetical protein GGF43_001256 [Coemansia sp. RSA 2618]KAJ2827988.1 hypothetical protein IWW50_001614 [Coemansia erecta]
MGIAYLTMNGKVLEDQDTINTNNVEVTAVNFDNRPIDLVLHFVGYPFVSRSRSFVVHAGTTVQQLRTICARMLSKDSVVLLVSGNEVGDKYVFEEGEVCSLTLIDSSQMQMSVQLDVDDVVKASPLVVS